jgi:hypothetical protein
MRIFSDHSQELRHVGVQEFPGKRKTRLLAYTQWYPPEAQICMHHVHATSGAEAKKLAMAEHRAKCMGGSAGGGR